TNVASMGESLAGNFSLLPPGFAGPEDFLLVVDFLRVADFFPGDVFFVSVPFERLEFQTRLSAFATCSIVLPDCTDLVFFVTSVVEACLSFNFISSHAFSPRPLAFTSANSPLSFLPWMRNFSLPLCS